MTRALPPIREFHATSGWVVLSVASTEPTAGTNGSLEGAQAASCAFCGGVFAARRSTARFCSSTCRSRAHRRSKNDEAVAA